MSLDVYNLSAKELTQLNNSLMKYKESSLVKLHNLQRVNHNLIIENTKLRQTLKYGSKDRESLLMGRKDVKGQSAVKTMEVSVEAYDDMTAVVHFKCLLSPSEISDYFNCDFVDLQYKVVLVEWRGDVVENASTVTTKQSQLKLKMLQNNIKYLVTVHLCGKDKKLSGQTQFVYNQMQALKSKEPPSTKVTESEDKRDYRKAEEGNSVPKSEKDPNLVKVKDKGAEESELNTKGMQYALNLQIDDDYYITCKFSENDSLEEVVDKFVEKNRIKQFLRDNILKCVSELKSSGDSIRTVDVTDLISV